MGESSNGSDGLLNSWKEIAVYLNRGIRTVQRWQQFGLPVRRIGRGKRAPVVAYKRDIDAWMRAATPHGFKTPQSAQQIMTRGTLHRSVEQSRVLREQLTSLLDRQQKTIAQLSRGIAEVQKSCTTRVPQPTDDSQHGHH